MVYQFHFCGFVLNIFNVLLRRRRVVRRRHFVICGG